MHQHTVPPVSDVENKSALVRMGFPTYAYFPVLETRPTAAESATNAAKEFGMRRRGRYSCPRCGALEAELPAECQSCGLFLVLSPHLARTFHHLFPLDTFTETITTTTDKPCAGCTRHLAETVRKRTENKGTRARMLQYQLPTKIINVALTVLSMSHSLNPSLCPIQLPGVRMPQLQPAVLLRL